jgi:3-oxoacyl-[acyl-carrier-protein] synthase III
VRFLAVEHALPSKVVSNADVLQAITEASARHLGEHDLKQLLRMTSKVFAQTGTNLRYHLAEHETAFDMACAAGRQALRSSGRTPDDIDLLIYVGVGRGMLEPATAAIFQDALELRRATCFDIIDACASWVRALHVADTFLATKAYTTVMILNAEFGGKVAYRYQLRSLEEFAHWHPSVTIGEAATATILTTDSAHGDCMFDFLTRGDKRELCFVPLPNFASYFGKPIDEAIPVDGFQFVSYGRELLSFGARKLIEHFKAREDFCRYQPDMIFIHAASDGAADFVRQQLNFAEDKFVLSHHQFANTVSASIPLAMSSAMKTGTLREGAQVLLLMASAGVTTALVRFTFRQ